MGENLFPSSVPAAELKEPTEEYYAAVLSLALTVLEILARGLNYGADVFKSFVSNDPICTLRLLHYPPRSSGAENQLGAGAHTDFGAVTLLLQDDAGGLEVLDHATGNFVPVQPNPEAYVVNVGDMLSMWTSGVYKSNVHRVINKGVGDRYSVPFFFDGNADTKLAPLDGGEPMGGKVLTVEEHMLERFGTTYIKT
jgi:isopenicillin N synthase-like dioxygenase